MRQIVVYGLLIGLLISLFSPRRVARNIMALQIVRHALHGTRPAAGFLLTSLESTPMGRVLARREAWTLARWYRARGDAATSVGYYSAALEQQPDNPLVGLQLGTLYDELGQPEEALRWWRESDSAGYWDARGTAALRAKDFAAADAFLARAREVSPANALVLYDSGELFFALSEWSRAIACYSAAIEHQRGDDPWLADAYLNRGRAILQAGGSVAMAETDLLQALSLRPEDPWVYLRLCELYREGGRLEDALSYCQRAVSLSPRSAYVYYYLGRVRAEQKRYALAADALREALRYDPRLEAAAEWLARVQQQEGTID